MYLDTKSKKLVSIVSIITSAQFKVWALSNYKETYIIVFSTMLKQEIYRNEGAMKSQEYNRCLSRDVLLLFRPIAIQIRGWEPNHIHISYKHKHMPIQTFIKFMHINIYSTNILTQLGNNVEHVWLSSPRLTFLCLNEIKKGGMR